MSQVTVTLPDGSGRSVPAGTAVREVAMAISPRLASAALAASVNDRLVDLTYPLTADARVRIVTEQTPEALVLDMPLQVAFEPLDEEITLPLFRPAKEGA